MAISIYTIIDPRNNQVRYIGKTKSPNRRIANHKAYARKLICASAFYLWLESLLSAGLEPIIEVIEVVENEYALEREKAVIQAYIDEGHQILNTYGGNVKRRPRNVSFH